MKAYEKDIAEIVEGKRQYVIPLFQRAYVWEKQHWQTLWNDIRDVCNNNESHFFGTFVVTPIETDGGIKKFLLIDGQQRLTTLFLLLSAIRTISKQDEMTEYLSKEIESSYLLNGFRNDSDSYKLLPSKLKKNRDSFQNIISEKSGNAAKNAITDAFLFFERTLRTENKLDLERLVRVIMNKLNIVYIELAKEDDSYKIFESLNATGEALTQADLVRNYFFMRLNLSESESEEIYNRYWNPIQDTLEDSIGVFLRHFLMKDSVMVKINDVYRRLKANVDNLHTQAEVLTYLKQLSQFSEYYAKFLKPEREKNADIRLRLLRIKQLDVTVIYPFLLSIYHAYDEEKIELAVFLQIFDIIENFLVRRLICNIPTHGLNRIFPYLYDKAKSHPNLVEGIKNELLPRQYPSDDEFAKNFMTIKIYGKKEPVLRRTKFILTRLEQFNNKEPVDLTNADISIEHIMPQTLNRHWKDYLGSHGTKVHQEWCNTLGNLTLTASNSELGQKSFQAKKKILESSHLQLNRYFINIAQWQEEDIQQRAEKLKNIALEIWNYFGDAQNQIIAEVTGKKPQSLTIQDKQYEPSSWRDVMELTMNHVVNYVDAQAFEQMITDFPNNISWENDKFRRSCQLSNGAYININFSANDIYSFCRKIIDIAGLLESKDWIIEIT
jgi:uncharacterized protein with ParB-like and HNH nuclease domain